MILYKDESYKILGAAFEVYNELGPGFLEPVYQECFEYVLKERGIPYFREKNIQIYFKGRKIKKEYQADFLCYDNIIVELKAVSELNSSHKAQLYNYLHATRCKLGLLLNFGHCLKLEVARIVL